MREFGEFRYANELVASSAPRPAITFTSKSPPIPNFTPRHRAPNATCSTSSARSKPAPTAPSPSISTTRTPISASWTTAPKTGARFAHRARHHADHQFHPTGAVLGRLRSGNSALDSQALESFGDDRDAIRAFGLDVVSDLCRACWTAARRAAFLHHESGGPTLAIASGWD
jgi:methylenetetrahydrofolate reductase (NADPH)